MRTRLVRLTIAALPLVPVALSGCKDKPKPPPMVDVAQAMPNLPLPPNPTFLSRAGSPDALQLTFRSTSTVDEVTAYYRTVLNRPPWSLTSDAHDPSGRVALYAVQNGKPFWVRIAPDGQNRGSLVELAGAVPPLPDTSKVARLERERAAKVGDAARLNAAVDSVAARRATDSTKHKRAPGS